MEMKELSLFVTEVINTPTPSYICSKIHPHLKSIRQQFLEPRNKPNDIKLSFSKLSYASLCGIHIDFGLPQLITLLQSPILSHIRIGWIAASLVYGDDKDSTSALIPLLKNQLNMFGKDPVLCTALSFAATIFDEDQMKEIAPDICNVVVCQSASEFARKKALLILSHYPVTVLNESLVHIIEPTLESYFLSLGNSISLATATLVLSLMTSRPGSFTQFFTLSLQQLLYLVGEAVTNQLYLYMDTPSPWYTRQLFRILQLKTIWTEEEKNDLELISLSIIRRSGDTLLIRAAYSYLIVFSELMSLISLNPLTDNTMKFVVESLCRHMASKKINIVFFALDSLNRLTRTSPILIPSVQKAEIDLISTMKNVDQRVSRKSISILYSIGDKSNCKRIVEEMVRYLPSSPLEIRKFLSHNATQLVKQFSPDPGFFVNSIIELMKVAGSYCIDSEWHLTLSAISLNLSIQEIALDQLVTILKTNTCIPDPLMKLIVYVIGEYLQTDVGSVVNILVNRFDNLGDNLQEMIISSVSKITTRTPQLLNKTREFLKRNFASSSPGVSQRSKECFYILTTEPGSKQLLSQPLTPILHEDIKMHIKKIVDTSQGKIGVSEFNTDNIDQPEDANNEKFLYIDEGELFSDKTFTIFAKYSYQKPKVALSLNITNKELIPLNILGVHIESPANIQHRLSDYQNTIPYQQSSILEIEFSIQSFCAQHPVMIMKYQLGNTKHESKLTLPIQYQRVE